MIKLGGILIAAAIVWAMLIAACWSYWLSVGRRQGGSLVPTSWRSILLMPAWTVECWLVVYWRSAAERRQVRKHLRRLRRMERGAPPGVPQELMQRLRDEIARLQALLDGSDAGDQTRAAGRSATQRK